MSDENIVIAVQDKVDANVATKIQQIANSARDASTAVASLQAQLAGLGGVTELNAALATSQSTVTGLQESMSALTSQTTTLTTAVVNHTTATVSMGESEAEATARIKAMIAASLEAHAVMTDNTTATAAYAASVDEMAAAATLAERSNVGIAASATEAAVAQTEAAAAFTAASTTVSAGAASVAEALNRQLEALTATKAEMVAYDAQMAGMTATEVAQLKAIAEEIDLRKTQMALGAQMAAVYEAEAAAAGTAKVATSGVTSELFVLGREAASGNYTKLAGSFTRFLSLAGALQLLLNPVSIGLIAVGGAFLYTANQTDKMNQSLVLTGNYAGITTDQMRDMAQAATASGASFGTAVEAMTALANTGRLTGQEIQSVGTTIATLSTVTGESVSKMVTEFTKLADDPVKASVALNQQYNYLTASVYDQIVALQKQGDETGAAQLAVETFASVMNDRTADIQKNQGAIITGWHAIKDAISDAVQAVGNFGSKSPENVMDQLQLRKNGQVANGVWTQDDEAELQKATQAYIKSVTDAQNQLQVQAQEKQLINAKQAYTSWNEQFATPAEKRAEAIQKYLDNIATPLGLSAEQQLSDQDKINAKYPDKKNNAAHRQQQNELSAQMVALQSYSDAAKAIYQQQTADLQTALNTQQITQAQYIVQLGADKQKELQTLADVAQKEADLALGKDQLSARQKYLNEVKKYNADMVTNAAQTQAQLSALNAKTTFDALKQLQSLQQVGQQRDSANQNTLDSAGLGSKEIADITTLQAVANRAAQARLALTQQAEKDGTQYSTAYINGIKDINDEEQNQLANEKIFFQARDEMQANWMNGVTAGMQNFIDTSENVAASAQQAFTSAFTGINNALATFVTTGKLNFSSLANSIISDIIKIQLQSSESTILKALMGVASSGASDFSGAFGFSGGGSTSAVGSGLSTLFGSGYAAGGYTGNGGINEPAGVVHGKEFVVNAKAVAQPGVMQLLTALNSGKKGYADGGYVGSNVPTIQTAQPVQNNMTVNIVNNASDQVAVTAKQGTDSAGNPTLEVMANLLEGQLAGKIASGRGKLHDSISTKFGLQSRPGRV